MGRPKKAEQGPVSTKERIFKRALELFAAKGYDAVSVRDITKSLHLNEATLYIHYKNKSTLLDEILERLQKNLIDPGFRVPPAEMFAADGGVDPAEYLVEGATRFFDRTDRDTLLTWRMLMISQYRYEAARSTVEEQLLNAPQRFFSALLQHMQSAGCIAETVDCRSAGRIIAAMFFEYSFRANLKAAWDEESDEDFSRLKEDVRSIAEWLQAG
mgnify:CR=1 FL=1